MLAEEGSVFMNTGTNGNEPGTEDVEVYGNLGVINKNYGWDPNPGTMLLLFLLHSLQVNLN